MNFLQATYLASIPQILWPHDIRVARREIRQEFLPDFSDRDGNAHEVQAILAFELSAQLCTYVALSVAAGAVVSVV